MFSVQLLNLNGDRRTLRIYFFLRIKLQERLIKIQLAHISKSYIKFLHAPELSHSVHRGINPFPSKTPSSLFLENPPANRPGPLFRQFLVYIVFL